MEIKCSMQPCTNPVKFKCLCKDQKFLMCQEHSSIHCQEPGLHKLLLVFKSLDQLSVNLYVNKSMEKHNTLKTIKSMLRERTFDLINIIYQKYFEAVKKINNKQSLIRKNIKSALFTKEILIKDYASFLEMEDCDFDVNPLLFDTVDIEKKTDEFFDKNFYEGVIKVPSDKSVEMVKSMIFFQQNTKTLTNISLLDLSVTKKTMNLPENMGASAGWCRIPKGKIFHYGGQLNPLYKPLCSCYIIDPQNLTAEKCPDGPNRKYTIGPCALLNDKIYIFGGSGVLGSLLSNSEMFSLIDNTWTTIANMPIASDYNCTAIYKDSIFVTGYRIGVLLYSPVSNTYKELTQTVQGMKIVFTDSHSIYVLHMGTIIEFTNGAWEILTKDSNLPVEPYLLSYPIKHSIWIYFILSNKSLYRFDLTTKSINCIALSNF
ncbi:hypothetical protein SteCoe_17141 [Stentor coeruleus]|uniref:Uncharacterized protein n=1 Tax=Stentor coeruleus TaxID=5963 RepID=A0A1R2BZX4_9CILI|nr:hypothetical protein SteCoe_17141 [Stentor coeruleus]